VVKAFKLYFKHKANAQSNQN